MPVKAERWEHPLEHPPGYSIDLELPLKGGKTSRVSIAIPKKPALNRQWRRRMLDAARDNPERQHALRAMCGAGLPGLLLWFNLFCFTYQVKRVQADGSEKPVAGKDQHQPFITWPVQDVAIAKLYRNITEGRDLAIDKSRDMGATWVILGVFVWFWLFRPGSHFIVMSRAAELVFKRGDPDTLFWKMEYLLDRLPEWMRPDGFDKEKQVAELLANPANGSTIVGRSTTAKKGAGSRVLAVMFDEAGLIKELRSLWVGFSASTSCRIVNSTPQGPCFYSDLVLGGGIDLIELAWWDHPIKGRGRRKTTDKHGKTGVTSPFYEAKKAIAKDPREISQELDRDHMGAGQVFFVPTTLAIHAATSVRPAFLTGAIEFSGSGLEDRAIKDRVTRHFEFFDDEQSGPWKLWLDLKRDSSGLWRPPQDRMYVFGSDVALGTSAANSTICVLDADTWEQVAEFASGNVTPEQFSRLMAIAGFWFGGPRGCAFVGWESNGVGNLVTKTLVHRLHYPWVYFRVDDTVRGGNVQGDRYGWNSTTQAKIDLLGEFSGALNRSEFIPRSERLIRECRSYVWMDDGGVGPGQLEVESQMARKTHGDRVIAAAIAKSIAKFSGRCRPPERVAPVGSPMEVAQRHGKRIA